MTSKPSSSVRPWTRLGFAAAAAVLVAAGAATMMSGEQPQAAARLAAEADAFPNFDIRLDKAKATPEQADFLATVAVAPDTGAALFEYEQATVASLRAAGVVVESSPGLGTTEVVSAPLTGGFLTGPSEDRVAALRSYVQANAFAYGIAADQAQSLEVVADYVNPAGNMAWVELEQRFGGIPVFQGVLRGGFSAKGELIRTTGVLAAGVDSSQLASQPSRSAAQAVAASAANVGWNVAEGSLVEKPSGDPQRVTFDRGTMAADPSAWLVYFPLSRGVARLAWATQIVGDPYGFLTVVDAETGTILFRKNLTNFQTQSASYNVYNNDSPAPSSPTTALPGANFQAPFIARQTITRVGNEAPDIFNNLGWMTDGLNETAGNNVRAGLDLVAPDGIEATVPGTGRVFNFAYNPETDAPTTANYRNGEVTDMFYWTNVYHDRLYLLGFTEAARNFQQDNFGRGGVGNDRVNAEGQDFSGTNNANFLTPADGTSGRMQMFLFTGPTPDRTSAIDHDVLLHELTHGTSNRLHANGSGLGTTMSGGMGEGWSDFYARALLAGADEDPNGIFTTGGWVTHSIAVGFTDNYYYGIRRFPYAVMSTRGGPSNRPHNPLTFADIDSTQFNIGDGAFPRGPIGSATPYQVHNVGEVWASALNEVRARFITRLGFAVGNQRILQFVTDGMKLDPVNPTMLQGRDSIIAAATAGGGTAADINDIWAGFAVRGMGVSAAVISVATGRVTEAFDVPGIAATTATLVSESIPNGRIDAGETVGVNFCVTNTATGTSGEITALLQASGGIVSPSGPQSFGTVASGASSCRTFTFVASAACGASVTPTFLAQESGATTRTLSYSLPVGNFVPFFTENFDGVTAPALPAGWSTSTLTGGANPWVTSTTAPDTPPNRAFVADPAIVTDNVLLTPSIGLPGGSHRVIFRHSFATEANFDGGVLEISVGGGAFQDILAAGGSFASNGYNSVISTNFSSPIGGRQAWSGSSSGYVTTAVNLPASASGQNIRLRFRMATDSSVASTGWAVDGVTINTATCTAVPAQAEPPTNLVPISVVGNLVTLTWTPPSAGLTPTGYILEGGPTPASVAASIPTGSPFPSYTFIAPNGSWYVRIHTVSGASKSAASNEVRIHVNMPVAPSAPMNLLGTVNGSNIALAWENTYSGGSPSNILLDVSGALNTTLPLGLSEGFQFAGVPGGTYTLRLRAQNAFGTSPSSNAITLTFPGACTGVPQAVTNVVASKVGNTVFVNWDPAPAGPAPVSYILNVTGAFVGSFPTPTRGLSGVVGPGTYNLSVVAVNPCGSSTATTPVSVTVP